MLHVARVGHGRADYYLSDLAAEVAVVRDPTTQHSAAFLTGRASEALGLSGPVDPARFRALLDDGGPNGRPLVRAPTAVAAYDLTFTCPKSVSVLFGVGAGEMPGEVVSAHDAAVTATLEYIEARAIAVRRGTGEDRHLVSTGGIVGAAFTHGTSRSLDPHLHTHVVVLNAAHGTDGRWSAIDGRGIRAHAAAAGALYDSHLRHELVRRLAVSWASGPMGTAPELHGVSPAVRATFSGRQAEIRQEQWGRNTSSRRAARVAWAVTRPAKTDVDPDALVRRWVDRAADAGLLPAAIDRITGQRQPASRVVAIDEHRFSAALWNSRHAGGPARRDAIAAWAGAVTQGSPAREVVGAVEAWAPAGRTLGVDEPPLALRDLVPSAVVARTLGPRPTGAEDQAVYRLGAAAIDGYRQRWGLHDTTTVLGVDGSPSSLASMPARRLAEHLEVERTLRDVARELGREIMVRDRGHELAQGRALGD